MLVDLRWVYGDVSEGWTFNEPRESVVDVNVVDFM
jgi:hypothetical protein